VGGGCGEGIPGGQATHHLTPALLLTHSLSLQPVLFVLSWCRGGGVVVVVLWCCGVVVLWCCGVVVVWWCGGVVLWSRGLVVLWCCGVVVLLALACSCVCYHTTTRLHDSIHAQQAKGRTCCHSLLHARDHNLIQRSIQSLRHS